MVGPEKDLRCQALELIAEDGTKVGPRLSRLTGVSRQVANGILLSLERDGAVEATGQTRAKVYRLVPTVSKVFDLAREGLQEDRVWRDHLHPELRDLGQNVVSIWHYACTEIINNAIDHSGSAWVQVHLRRDALNTAIDVVDGGEGIFLHIQRVMSLDDPRESILELAKGKLTTAPEAHSGEGIFFTSRALDRFELESGGLCFRHTPGVEDSIRTVGNNGPGTVVRMELRNGSTKVLREVFDAYTDPEELTFDRTVVPLQLAQYEDQALVSRSQAKRLANRFARFKRVELDFTGVDEIGQGFADELFRVFARAHPDVGLVPINMSETVDRMIRRVVATGNGK